MTVESFKLIPLSYRKSAVTPHLTPLSTLICFAAAALRCASVCFHTERRISAFWRVRFKKRSKIERFSSMPGAVYKPLLLHIIRCTFHIDNRTIANYGFWVEYASKTPLEVQCSRPPMLNAAFLTPESNNAASERSHQTALFSKRLLTPHYWLDMKGVWVLAHLTCPIHLWGNSK